MFGDVVGDGVGEVVFADQGFADDVGVCEGGGWVREEVREVDLFVGSYLKEWGRWGWEIHEAGYKGIGRGSELGFYGFED